MPLTLSGATQHPPAPTFLPTRCFCLTLSTRAGRCQHLPAESVQQDRSPPGSGPASETDSVGGGVKGEGLRPLRQGVDLEQP